MTAYFITWYYNIAPSVYWGYLTRLIRDLYLYFSVPDIIKTLFSPWRHDQIPISQVSFSEKFQVIGENLVSIIIGFIVRGVTLIVAAIIIGILLIIGVCLFILWYLWPLVAAFFMIKGFTLIIGAMT